MHPMEAVATFLSDLLTPFFIWLTEKVPAAGSFETLEEKQSSALVVAGVGIAVIGAIIAVLKMFLIGTLVYTAGSWIAGVGMVRAVAGTDWNESVLGGAILGAVLAALWYTISRKISS